LLFYVSFLFDFGELMHQFGAEDCFEDCFEDAGCLTVFFGVLASSSLTEWAITGLWMLESTAQPREVLTP
jgi:hypothetical protein